MKNKSTFGHLACLFSVIVWGTTFISTKLLLVNFNPVEILFYRFIIGILTLYIVHPHMLKVKSWKHEITFILTALSGVTLYYLLENLALTYTSASNVGVITSAAPFFTALLAYFFIKEEHRLKISFFIGFIFAIIGIALVSFNGAQLQLNPFGDLLALTAAFCWGCYGICYKKVSSYGYSLFGATRRIILYGTVLLLPSLRFFDVSLDFQRFLSPAILANYLYLGLLASGLCFVTWNYSVNVLGTIKTSVYIYAIPLVTVIASALILDESITPISGLGTVLIVIGLGISEFL